MKKTAAMGLVCFLFTSLSLSATPINVSNLATSGTGADKSTCWRGWETASAWVGEQEYHFPGGSYCADVFPNFLKTGIALVGEAGTILYHTGSGNAVVFDNPGGWTENVRMENFIIVGNAATTNGLLLRGVRNGIFKHISVRDVSGAGVWTEACVTNILENFRVTHWENNPSGTWNVTPAYGIVIGTRQLDSQSSTTWTIINPIIEDVSTIGIWIKPGCFANTIINGTSEGNPGKGAVIEGGSNTFIGTDFEVNGGTDIEVSESRNSFIDVWSSGSVILNPSQQNKFIGGNYHNITVHPYCLATLFQDIIYTGVFNDASNSTIRFGNTTYALDFRAFIGNYIPRIFQPLQYDTVICDVSLFSLFNLVIDHNMVLGTPINPTSGQKVTWKVTQQPPGQHTLGFSPKFIPPPGKALPVPPLASGAYIYFSAIYNASTTTWDIQNEGTAY